MSQQILRRRPPPLWPEFLRLERLVASLDHLRDFLDGVFILEKLRF